MYFRHFCQRSYQIGSIAEDELTIDAFRRLLKEKISKTDIEMVKTDVRPFIKNTSEMNIWSNDYFLQLADMIQFL